MRESNGLGPSIYVRSQRAGERVMASIEQFLAKRLKLKVNKAKSAVAAPRARSRRWHRTLSEAAYGPSGASSPMAASPAAAPSGSVASRNCSGTGSTLARRSIAAKRFGGGRRAGRMTAFAPGRRLLVTGHAAGYKVGDRQVGGACTR